MDIDLYTFASFIVGVLAGCLGGIWLSGLISSHKVERLEQKVNVLSDNKFKVTGERVQLKQLEERLDAAAASIPLAERELKDKSGEIRELTTALNETTALTSELAEALRIRKAKVQQLQVEQGKWIKRNKALLIKTGHAENKINQLKGDVIEQRDINAKLNDGEEQTESAVSDTAAGHARQAFFGDTKPASPALAASHHVQEGDDETVDRLNSRLREMESELQNWVDRVGKLEATQTGQYPASSNYSLLEEVLRDEADKEGSVGSDAPPQLLGGRSAS